VQMPIVTGTEGERGGSAGALAEGWPPRCVPRVRRALAVLACAILAACSGPIESPGTPTGSDSSATGPTGIPTPTTVTVMPTPPPDEAVLAAYFIVDTGGGPRLVREVRNEVGGGLQQAVERMIDGPTDPDHVTAWNAETVVLGVDVGEMITIDLSPEARGVDSNPALTSMMVQQLVYTATEAVGDPDAAVSLLIDGAPAGNLGGGVTWSEPMGRADPLEVRTPVQVESPSEGQRFTDPNVVIVGEAFLGGSDLAWRIVDLAGEEVASGAVTAGPGTTFEPFSLEVELELPGYYTVEVTGEDPTSGSPVTATRSFSVHLAA